MHKKYKKDSISKNVEDIEKLERVEVAEELSEIQLLLQIRHLLRDILTELKAEHATVKSFNIVQR